MAAVEDKEEKLALRAELKWLLREEVHSVLDSIDHTLQECRSFFPIELPGGAKRQNEDHTSNTEQLFHRGTERLLLTGTGTATPGVLKCMMTLKGDSISEADVQFNFKVKDKSKDGPLQKTSIHREKQWKLHQIRDAANHLQEALQIVSLRQKDHQFKSAQEVLMLMERLTKNVQSCRECLCIPKRKSLQDLANSKSRMEAVVKWLNEIAVLSTIALQQCQQLVDKITMVCQCAGVDRSLYMT